MVKSLCMRINLNKDDLAKVQNLLQTNENNIAVSDIFNEYLMEYEKDINKKTLNNYLDTKEIKTTDKGFSLQLTEEEASIYKEGKFMVFEDNKDGTYTVAAKTDSIGPRV